MALQQSSTAAGAAWGLRSKLQEVWTARSSLVREIEQPKIGFEPERNKFIFKPAECQKQGVCVCGASGGDGKVALQFHQRLAATLKQHCWSKKKQKSFARKQLENGFLVIRLAAVGEEGATPEDLPCAWFHIGYVNYTTWKMCFHRMLLDQSPEERLPGVTCLRSVCMDTDAGQDSEQCFMTSVQAILRDIDLDAAHTVLLYNISVEEQGLSRERMRFGYIRVRMLQLSVLGLRMEICQSCVSC